MKDEQTFWRDQTLSQRHRQWGFDCPATDLDFLLIEYDRGKCRALIEYKRETAAVQFATHPTYVAIRDLADQAQIPFLAVRYSRDLSWFTCTPLNEKAKNYFLNGNNRLSEREFVALLYAIRDRRMPVELMDRLYA